MYQFSNRSLTILRQLHPDIQRVLMAAILRSPIDFGIPKDGGLRTAERQNELFMDNKSKCDGYENISNHQTGNAVDVFAYVNRKGSWDDCHLSIIAGVVLSTAAQMGVKMRWGGTFGSNVLKGWDKPHFELMED